MALWDKITSKGNVEDRRGMSPIAGGGIGLTGLAIVLLITYLNGGSIGDVLTQIGGVAPTTQTQQDTTQFQGEDSYEVFTSKVLGSADDMWATIFKEKGLTYTGPKLVLFRTNTQSACGGADSRVGPHYCPLDETIYMDETFFDEINKRLGAQGGDVAQAYVIAHEIGHHAQQKLGILKEGASNEESIKTELQADCLAGMWANSIKDLDVLQPGEIKEALDTATAVGDDRIQSKTTGRVNPESWTHGSSLDRVAAFTVGYETGEISRCNF